jgi:hypothetical protein
MATPPTPVQFVQPNLYTLSGSELNITYSTSGFDGKPHFSYQSATETLNFAGDEIQTADSPLGMLVTVFVRRTVDAGSTTFTLLVPRVNLDARERLPISTVGITTLHRFSILQTMNHGQLDRYMVQPLTGTASQVFF